MTNKEFAATDNHFRDACRHVDLLPTRRQASKFRRKCGLAFKGHKADDVQARRSRRPNNG